MQSGRPRAQRLHRAHRLGLLLDLGGLRDLDQQPGGERRLGVEQIEQPGPEGRALQREAGEVGGDPRAPAAPGGAADRLQHRPVELLREAHGLGEGDEVSGIM